MSMAHSVILYRKYLDSSTIVSFCPNLTTALQSVTPGDRIVVDGQLEYIISDDGVIVPLMGHPWLDDMRVHLDMLRGKMEITHISKSKDYVKNNCKICIKALRQRTKYIQAKKSIMRIDG